MKIVVHLILVSQKGIKVRTNKFSLCDSDDVIKYWGKISQVVSGAS